MPHALCRCKPEKLIQLKKVSARHLFAYEGELAKGLIYKLKRKNLSSLQKFFARECASLAREELRAGGDYVISFAPRAVSGIREYGFDQAELLARGAAKELCLPFEKVFVRKRGANVQQKALGAKQREENAQSAFELCEGAPLSGKRLILFDDVTTTGSTAKRLCELASEAGAEKILFISAAKT